MDVIPVNTEHPEIRETLEEYQGFLMLDLKSNNYIHVEEETLRIITKDVLTQRMINKIIKETAVLFPRVENIQINDVNITQEIFGCDHPKLVIFIKFMFVVMITLIAIIHENTMTIQEQEPIICYIRKNRTQPYLQNVIETIGENIRPLIVYIVELIIILYFRYCVDGFMGLKVLIENTMLVNVSFKDLGIHFINYIILYFFLIALLMSLKSYKESSTFVTTQIIIIQVLLNIIGIITLRQCNNSVYFPIISILLVIYYPSITYCKWQVLMKVIVLNIIWLGIYLFVVSKRKPTA